MHNNITASISVGFLEKS